MIVRSGNSRFTVCAQAAAKLRCIECAENRGFTQHAPASADPRVSFQAKRNTFRPRCVYECRAIPISGKFGRVVQDKFEKATSGGLRSCLDGLYRTATREFAAQYVVIVLAALIEFLEPGQAANRQQDRVQ